VLDHDYEEEILRLRELLFEERRRARTDVVTGLDNRRSFETQVRDLADSDESFAVVIVDACNLHTANKVLGYDGGDSLLREIARCVRAECDVAYRIGGDEFAVIVQTGSSGLLQVAMEVAVRMQDAVGRRQLLPGVSFGLAVGAAKFSGDLDAMLKLAHLRCMENKLALKEAWGEDEAR